MKKIIYIFALLVCAEDTFGQHSTLTSNYLFNLFSINPAYAGQRKALDVSAFYRKQWAGLSGAPETVSFLSSLEIKPKNLSVGLQYDNDKIGFTNINNVKLAFSYRVKVYQGHTISFGLMPGYKRINYNYNKLITTTAGDETFNINSPVINTFNTSSGIFYYSKKIYFGVSSPEMLNISGTKKYSEINIIGGYILKINENITLKPSFLFRAIKNSPSQYDLNLTTYLNQDLGIGFSYRNKEAIVAFIDYTLSKKVKIGYAYDYSIGTLRKFNSGTHEIMLNYFFGKFSSAPAPRFF